MVLGSLLIHVRGKKTGGRRMSVTVCSAFRNARDADGEVSIPFPRADRDSIPGGSPRGMTGLFSHSTYGIKMSFGGSGTLKIVIRERDLYVEKYVPPETKNWLDDYHPSVGGVRVLQALSKRAAAARSPRSRVTLSTIDRTIVFCRG